MENCYYKTVCNLYKVKGECDSGCIRYNEMNYLIKHSHLRGNQLNIPKMRCEEVDKKAFEYFKFYRENIKENIAQGKNLYIWSYGCGNGKTTTAIKLLLAYFDEIWAGNGMKKRGIFVNVPQFLLEIHDNFELKSTDFLEFKQELKTIDLLILDDLGVSKRHNNYDNEQILSIVDERTLNNLTTIYTSNIAPEDLGNILDMRTASRVLNNCITIELKGKDRRYDRTTSIE